MLIQDHILLAKIMISTCHKVNDYKNYKNYAGEMICVISLLCCNRWQTYSTHSEHQLHVSHIYRLLSHDWIEQQSVLLCRSYLWKRAFIYCVSKYKRRVNHCIFLRADVQLFKKSQNANARMHENTNEIGLLVLTHFTRSFTHLERIRNIRNLADS